MSDAPGEEGGRFFIENPRGGGSPGRVRAGGEGLGGRLRGIWGRGAKHFFSGPKFPHQVSSKIQANVSRH